MCHLCRCCGVKLRGHEEISITSICSIYIPYSIPITLLKFCLHQLGGTRYATSTFLRVVIKRNHVRSSLLAYTTSAHYANEILQLYVHVEIQVINCYVLF